MIKEWSRRGPAAAVWLACVPEFESEVVPAGAFDSSGAIHGPVPIMLFEKADRLAAKRTKLPTAPRQIAPFWCTLSRAGWQSIFSGCVARKRVGDRAAASSDPFNYCVDAKSGARGRHECPIGRRLSQVVCDTRLHGSEAYRNEAPHVHPG